MKKKAYLILGCLLILTYVGIVSVRNIALGFGSAVVNTVKSYDDFNEELKSKDTANSVIDTLMNQIREKIDIDTSNLDPTRAIVD